MAQTAKEIIDEQYGVWRFQDFLRKCARQSAEQLRDAYNMQKVWNNTPNNAVWIRSRKVKKLQKNGQWKTFTSWSWYNESKLREEKDKGIVGRVIDGKGKYWYSTGKSYEIARRGAVSVVNATREHGEIDFHTTWGAMWSEAGAGLTGRSHVRGARAKGGRKRIKIDRAQSYKGVAERRYVQEWIPMDGRTHRPLTRRQVNLFRRRLRWAALYYYRDKMVDFLTYSMYELFDSIAKDPTLFPNGYVAVDDYAPHAFETQKKRK